LFLGIFLNGAAEVHTVSDTRGKALKVETSVGPFETVAGHDGGVGQVGFGCDEGVGQGGAEGVAD